MKRTRCSARWHATPLVEATYDRNVRSFAKNTFGSTRTGSAMRLPGADCSSGCVDMTMCSISFLLLPSCRALSFTSSLGLSAAQSQHDLSRPDAIHLFFCNHLLRYLLRHSGSSSRHHADRRPALRSQAAADSLIDPSAPIRPHVSRHPGVGAAQFFRCNDHKFDRV